MSAQSAFLLDRVNASYTQISLLNDSHGELGLWLSGRHLPLSCEDLARYVVEFIFGLVEGSFLDRTANSHFFTGLWGAFDDQGKARKQCMAEALENWTASSLLLVYWA
jgi:hypothetical protein